MCSAWTARFACDLTAAERWFRISWVSPIEKSIIPASMARACATSASPLPLPFSSSPTNTTMCVIPVSSISMARANRALLHPASASPRNAVTRSGWDVWGGRWHGGRLAFFSRR